MDDFRLTISKLEQRLEAQLKEVAETKQAINLLLKMGGEPPRFTDIDAGIASASTVRSDEYYGQPLSSVVGDILARNKTYGGSAMSVNEIYEGMVKGGYKFETQSEDNAKRGLRISLTKNSTKFHRLPGGNWGLLEWYPKAKQPGKSVADEDSEIDRQIETHEGRDTKTDKPKERATDAA